MQRLIAALCLSLSLLLILCTTAGCKTEDATDTDREEKTSETAVAASDVCIRDYKKLSAADFLATPEIGEWLADAMAREQITNALLCPKEATDTSLHCYLYVGAFCEGDTLAFGVHPTNGTVLIRHTAADAEAVGSPYLFSFWIDAESMPDVELFQNDTSVGLVVSYTAAGLLD